MPGSKCYHPPFALPLERMEPIGAEGLPAEGDNSVEAVVRRDPIATQHHVAAFAFRRAGDPP